MRVIVGYAVIPRERRRPLFKDRWATLQLRMFCNHIVPFTLGLAYVVGWQGYFWERKGFMCFLKVGSKKGTTHTQTHTHTLTLSLSLSLFLSLSLTFLAWIDSYRKLPPDCTNLRSLNSVVTKVRPQVL